MINILLPIIIVIFIYVTLGFLISLILKRNDLADVMWGPGIFLGIYTSYLLNTNNSGYLTILVFLVFLWAVRIFQHIGLRFIHKREEDPRYKVWRETWKWFKLRSFFQVFLLQGFLMILVGSTLSLALHMMTTIENKLYISVCFNLGILISIVGLTVETFADLQLKKFLANKKNVGKILTTGVWKYSRHPNYFGEVIFWWGIFISLLPFFNFILLIGPITITFLILYVSGIPMTEKRYEGNKDFEEYKKVTPAFFPKFW